MLKMRLQRIGKKGQAYFRVIVTEHTTKPKGKYLELLGSYDPHKNVITVKAERIKYWLSQGVKLSETLNNLLVGRKIIEGEKVTVWKPKSRSRTETEGKKAKGGETPNINEVKTSEENKVEIPALPEIAQPAAL